MITGFADPPAENRPRPFWFFNGDMNRDEVRGQLLEMKAKGLGGFFLCARQGLRIPYLSAEWFDICKYTVELAREQGLEVWLYDEYPYPSGMSGGEVTIRHPEAKQKTLELLVRSVPDGGAVCESLGEGSILSAIAYPVAEGEIRWDSGESIAPHAGILQNQQIYQITEGGASYQNSFKRYFTYGPSKELRWESPGGDWHVVIAFEREIEDFKYFGTFVDPANPDAVQSFIDTTYEPYKDALSQDFGATVKGMFGDETQIHGHLPWSAQLPAYFEKKYGYSLLDHMGALIGGQYPDATRIRYNYFQCVHELLRDRYHKVLSEWCEQNGILYVTEVPSARMSNQMYSHVPGGDPCHDKLGYTFADVIDRDFHVIRQNPKIISAMARQFGRRDSLIEGFHSIGWTKTLQDAKWQIDRQTLMGISLHNFHAYYYTLDGITKHDAPPSQFLQNPYWEYYGAFADYCGRSSRFITETESSARVAVLHPAVPWMTKMRQAFHRFDYIGTDDAEAAYGAKLLDDYRYICKTMFFNQIDYDDLDPEVLAMGTVEGGVIAVGRAKYDTLLIPPYTCMEGYAFALIQRFVAGGGKLILVGVTPYDTIETDFDPIQAFASLGALSNDEYTGKIAAPFLTAANGITLVHTPGGVAAGDAAAQIAEAVKAVSPNMVEAIIPPEFRRDIITHRRERNHERFIMLASQNGVKADTAVLFRDCPPNANFYELDLETGETYAVEAAPTADGFLVAAPLTPWSARIIAMSEVKYPVAERPGGSVLRLELEPDEPVPVSVCGDNVYRLEDLTVSIDGSPGVAAKPSTFIEHFQAVGYCKAAHLQFTHGFGTPHRLSLSYPIPVTYRFRFRVDPQLLSADPHDSGDVSCPVQIRLMRDRMGIMGDHTISVNGTELSREAFVPAHIYDLSNIAANITPYIHGGANEIVVNAAPAEDWHGVSDPMYLLGGFGVESRDGEFIICKAPHTARVTAKAVTGYPFYTGKFVFETSVLCDDPGEYTRFTIELPERYRIYECVELELNGTPLGARAFSPYVWQGEARLLKKGRNQVRLTIANTLGNMLEGVYYDYAEKRSVSIRP